MQNLAGVHLNEIKGRIESVSPQNDLDAFIIDVATRIGEIRRSMENPMDIAVEVRVLSRALVGLVMAMCVRAEVRKVDERRAEGVVAVARIEARLRRG